MSMLNAELKISFNHADGWRLDVGPWSTVLESHPSKV